MEIMDREWNSLTDYDSELNQIRIYNNHPTLLPFIGRHYDYTRILLLGESHYLDSSESEESKKMKDWYNRPTEEYGFMSPENLNTRLVVNNYLNGRRSKAHSMFRNPAEALIKAWDLNDVNDSEAFTAFAFMNYFQRPEAASGKSINLTEEDKVEAYETFNKVINIIKPRLVLFLSQKAYWCYEGLTKGKIDQRIQYVYHPTSKYWNEKGGKDKAIKCFAEIAHENIYFSSNGWLLDKYVMSALKIKENHKIIDLHHKRFLENEVTVSIYHNPKPYHDYVSEIVWHVIDGNTKLGIGYVVKKKTLWIWDYTRENEHYLSMKEMQNYEELKRLYYDVIDVIQSL